MAFAEAGVEFEDRRVDHAQWPSLKGTAPFGQLPMLEIDGLHLAESMTILRYVGRKVNIGCCAVMFTFV